MQFTGVELTRKRNVYTQNTNFGFAVDCLVDNTTGRYDFGVSGVAGSVFSLTLNSGRILAGGTFVHSYAANERFYVECQVTPTQYNLLKNDSPMVFGLTKTSGDYNYVYFSRGDPALFADFNFYVSGQNLPNFSIQDYGYLLTTGQMGVTGNLANAGSYPIRVFASTAQATQDLAFTALTGDVTAGTNGPFSFNGDFSSFDFSQPILTTLDTNFGNSNVLFTIIDARSLNRFISLGNLANPVFNAQSQLPRVLSYSNYSSGFISDSFNAGLTFSLSYVSGSGQFTAPDFIDGANYSTTIYGSFAESGLLVGQALIPTGSNGISGNYIIDIARFGWATGPATGYFSGMGSGLASGLGYTGAAYGMVTGSVVVTINNGSGTFLLNSAVTGFGTNAVSTDYPAYGLATGYVTTSGLHYDDVLYIGIRSTPIIKGVQYTQETGLVYYLSGAIQHKVSSYLSGGAIYLTSRLSGDAGNGIFVNMDPCNAGTSPYSPFLTGGFNSGTTGNAVVAVSPFTTTATQTITGSGIYSVFATGFGDGTFYYSKTFTGQWDLLTGTTLNNLVSLKRVGNFDSRTISGSGQFPPNSQVAFKVVHIPNNFSTDAVQLTISGGEVINPITQTLSN